MQENPVDQILETIEKIHRLLGHKKTLSQQVGSVTLLQLSALMFVQQHPQCPVQMLGKHLELSSSAVAQLTERLVDAGMLERKTDTQDRRSTLLSLSKKGKTVSEHMAKKREAYFKNIFAYLPEKDVAELMRIFTTLLARLS